MEELSRAAIWQENWAGGVPLQLTLASTEVTALSAPPALYVMGPRLGYLPTVALQARAFFQHVLPPGDDTPWFECNRLALPWHVPLGVLYDLLARKRQRPWALTVHFRSFPRGRLLRWDGVASMRAAFFSSLKEAAYVCQGSAGGVMGMATSAQDELWAAVAAGDGSRVAAVSGALRLAPRARGDRRPMLPLRIYVRTADTEYIADLAEAVHFTSRPVEAILASGAARTLRDALSAVLAELLPSGWAPGGAEAAAELGSAAQTLQVGGREADVVVGGVRPPLDTPLAWLHSALAHADHFLYIAVMLHT
ncbi:hypothetical protein WJX81_000813 [Elliptochloris bilobata]|uniref:Autophagy protein 5 n=1 Tax=Elliptochloris bilobata TaxID=381761 RepID=A0AAW1SC68_9CHLO